MTRSRRNASGKPTSPLGLVGLAFFCALGGCAAAPSLSAHDRAQVAGGDVPQVGDRSYGRAAVRSFYARRPSPALWTTDAAPRPEAFQLVSLLRSSELEGPTSARYRLDDIERGLGDAQRGERPALSRSDQLLSHALVEYAADVHRPAPQNRITYIDPELAPQPPEPAALLAAASRSPATVLREIGRMHPLYSELRTGLSWYRTHYGSLPQLQLPAGPDLARGSNGDRVRLLRQRLGVPAGSGDPARFDAALASAVRKFRTVHGLGDAPIADAATIAALNAGAAPYERVILNNLDRARGLPADPGRRSILVDTAGARLSVFEGGVVRDTMRVIVGKPVMPTPQLAGLVRFAMIDPYWNIPPDLVRDNIAPKVLAEGTGYLENNNYEALSDWSATARVLRPDEVDWSAVASGARVLRMRQRPGGDNMMGRIKFMMPNHFGIYLHDTPKKALFAEADRHLSSGCVRVEDAARLAKWLFGRSVISGPGSATESRLDIPDPVPLYIIHLTARPEAGEIRLQKDVYARDRAAAASRWASAHAQGREAP